MWLLKHPMTSCSWRLSIGWLNNGHCLCLFEGIQYSWADFAVCHGQPLHFLARWHVSLLKCHSHPINTPPNYCSSNIGYYCSQWIEMNGSWVRCHHLCSCFEENKLALNKSLFGYTWCLNMNHVFQNIYLYLLRNMTGLLCLDNPCKLWIS